MRKILNTGSPEVTQKLNNAMKDLITSYISALLVLYLPSVLMVTT